MQKIDLLDTLYALNNDNVTESASNIFFIIESKLQVQELTYIDDALLYFNPIHTNKLASIALLRSTFRIKDIVHNWYSCRDNVLAEFERRDLDTKRLLRGLLSE